MADGEFTKLKSIRDQYAKVRSFAVATCENPQCKTGNRLDVRSELTSSGAGDPRTALCPPNTRAASTDWIMATGPGRPAHGAHKPSGTTELGHLL